MKRTGRAIALALTLAAIPAVASAAGPASRATAMGMGGATVTIPINAGPYRLTLVIGPMQQMYTQAQYRRLHPRRGEIMLRGSMAMPDMGMGQMHGQVRHLELHVMDRATMRVISDAMVSITYQPIVGMGMMPIKPQQVPISLMEGIGMGPSDIHYGNNVVMPAGRYHVWVHVNKVAATFTVHFT